MSNLLFLNKRNFALRNWVIDKSIKIRFYLTFSLGDYVGNVLLNSAFNISFWPETCNFIKKETRAQVFSCEFGEIFQNNFFTEHLWTAASFKHHKKWSYSQVLKIVHKNVSGKSLCLLYQNTSKESG